MRKIFMMAVTVLLGVSLAWGQDDFRKFAERSFSVSILKSVNFKNGKGTILFKSSDEEYFTTGDKINKIFAIESARLFRDVDDLSNLEMTIPLKEATYKMNITREQIEEFYKIKFSTIKGDLAAWQTKFIQKYDSKESRAKFCKKFAMKK